MSDDKTQRDRNRGVQARALLEDPLLVEAFTTARETYVAAWEATPVRDAEGREKLWMMIKLLEKVKGHLQQIVDDGKIAEAELTEIERRKRFRVFG